MTSTPTRALTSPASTIPFLSATQFLPAAVRFVLTHPPGGRQRKQPQSATTERLFREKNFPRSGQLAQDLENILVIGKLAQFVDLGEGNAALLVDHEHGALVDAQGRLGAHDAIAG